MKSLNSSLKTSNKIKTHELLSAFRTFELVIREIELGYRFDDLASKTILKEMKKAKTTLKKYFKVEK